MAGDPDPYDATLAAIQTRLTSLQSGAPATGDQGVWTQGELDAAIVEVQADEAELMQHWHIAKRTVADGEPAFCAACGEPRDCPTARLLFAKYSG